jgi:hypothetical protein
MIDIPRTTKPNSNSSLSKDKLNRLGREFDVATICVSTLSLNLESVDSGLGVSESFSGGGTTAGGAGICGITIDFKETYSGWAGSVGNRLPPSKIWSRSENNSSINLSASASADQGWMGVGAMDGSLSFGFVLTF